MIDSRKYKEKSGTPASLITQNDPFFLEDGKKSLYSVFFSPNDPNFGKRLRNYHMDPLMEVGVN